MLTIKLHERKKLRVSEKGPGDAESVKWRGKFRLVRMPQNTVLIFMWSFQKEVTV